MKSQYKSMKLHRWN